MRSPIVIVESLDITVHPSIAHAVLHMEIQDVKDGIYQAYDSNGQQLEIIVEKVEHERSFLFVKWKKCYEKIQIKKSKTDKQRSNDLRKKLIHYLECKGIVITNPESESLIKLIRQIGKYMAWKIE